MSYRVRKVTIHPNDAIYAWCDNLTKTTSNLKNSALFICRQIQSAVIKDPSSWNHQQKLLMREIGREYDAGYSKQNFYTRNPMTVSKLQTLLRIAGRSCDNTSSYSGATLKGALKSVVKSYNKYCNSMKEYHSNPQAFSKVPKFPNYIKNGIRSTTYISPCECLISYQKNRKGLDSVFAYLPGADDKPICLGRPIQNARLCAVTVKPENKDFSISFVFTVEESAEAAKTATRVAGIDFGVNNIMAVTNNCGLPCILFKGGPIKSANRFCSKRMGELQRSFAKSQISNEEFQRSISRIQNNHKNKIQDIMHKDSKLLIKWCADNDIGKVIMGVNDSWKNKPNLGKKNNQNFEQIPYDLLRKYINYLAATNGIRTAVQEESYTSSASFADHDQIPKYEITDHEVKEFSGKRITRGQYQTKDGKIINADLNASANIIRKYCPYAFDAEHPEPNFNKAYIIRHPDNPAAYSCRIS